MPRRLFDDATGSFVEDYSSSDPYGDELSEEFDPVVPETDTREFRFEERRRSGQGEAVEMSDANVRFAAGRSPTPMGGLTSNISSGPSIYDQLAQQMGIDPATAESIRSLRAQEGRVIDLQDSHIRGEQGGRYGMPSDFYKVQNVAALGREGNEQFPGIAQGEAAIEEAMKRAGQGRVELRPSRGERLPDLDERWRYIAGPNQTLNRRNHPFLTSNSEKMAQRHMFRAMSQIPEDTLRELLNDPKMQKDGAQGMLGLSMMGKRPRFTKMLQTAPANEIRKIARNMGDRDPGTAAKIGSAVTTAGKIGMSIFGGPMLAAAISAIDTTKAGGGLMDYAMNVGPSLASAYFGGMNPAIGPGAVQQGAGSTFATMNPRMESAFRLGAAGGIGQGLQGGLTALQLAGPRTGGLASAGALYNAPGGSLPISAGQSFTSGIQESFGLDQPADNVWDSAKNIYKSPGAKVVGEIGGGVAGATVLADDPTLPKSKSRSTSAGQAMAGAQNEDVIRRNYLEDNPWYDPEEDLYSPQAGI